MCGGVEPKTEQSVECIIMIIIEFRILFSLKPFYSSPDTWFQ